MPNPMSGTEDVARPLACPFCGSTSGFTLGANETHGVTPWRTVECQSCGARGPKSDYESTTDAEAIRLWNARANPSKSSNSSFDPWTPPGTGYEYEVLTMHGETVRGFPGMSSGSPEDRHWFRAHDGREFRLWELRAWRRI